MIKHKSFKIQKNTLKYKSFLMGASKIADKELSDLGIKISRDNEISNDRLLTIPKDSLEQYKELIRLKLNAGYWNDIVGENLIYFIFKLESNETIEYWYNENNRMEIAKLCTLLNKDPIEKTSSLLDYLAENAFYAEEIKKYSKRNLKL